MTWETVDPPELGQFVGWGTKKGQHITGKVLSYSDTKGKDYDGQPCPLLRVELTSKAASFNKDGERKNIDAGEVIALTCGQPGLRDYITEVAPRKGNLIKITLTGERKTPNGNMKVFQIQIDRATGESATDTTDSDDGFGDDSGDDEPPF